MGREEGLGRELEKEGAGVEHEGPRDSGRKVSRTSVVKTSAGVETMVEEEGPAEEEGASRGFSPLENHMSRPAVTRQSTESRRLIAHCARLLGAPKAV